MDLQWVVIFFCPQQGLIGGTLCSGRSVWKTCSESRSAAGVADTMIEAPVGHRHRRSLEAEIAAPETYRAVDGRLAGDAQAIQRAATGYAWARAASSKRCCQKVCQASYWARLGSNLL